MTHESDEQRQHDDHQSRQDKVYVPYKPFEAMWEVDSVFGTVSVWLKWFNFGLVVVAVTLGFLCLLLALYSQELTSGVFQALLGIAVAVLVLFAIALIADVINYGKTKTNNSHLPYEPGNVRAGAGEPGATEDRHEGGEPC